MDEDLNQDITDLKRFVCLVGPQGGNVLYEQYTAPAYEALQHLFLVIDTLQDKVSDLENSVLQLEYERDRQI